MLFYTIYTNYNYKPLARIRKPEISWNKFRRLALNKSSNIFQEEKKKNEVLIYICLKTKELVLNLTINLEICL